MGDSFSILNFTPEQRRECVIDMVEQKEFAENRWVIIALPSSKEEGKLVVGKINKVVEEEDGISYFVELKEGVYCCISHGEAFLIPEKFEEFAKEVCSAQDKIDSMERMQDLIKNGAPVFVTMSAAEGLKGAAATTSGLANLGGGSIAAGGFGMMGGIVVLAAAPALMTAASLLTITHAIEKDGVTKDLTKIAGVIGAAASTTGAVMLVTSAAASSAAAGAAGITSALATLGGGSVALGGLGMAGGIACVVGTAMTGTAVFGVLGWAAARSYRQACLLQSFNDCLVLFMYSGFDLTSLPHEYIPSEDIQAKALRRLKRRFSDRFPEAFANLDL